MSWAIAFSRGSRIQQMEKELVDTQRQLDEERARLDWVLCQVSWEGPRIGIEFCWPADDDPRETIDRERIKGEKA